MKKDHLDIAAIRADYALAELDMHQAPAHPIAFFQQWFQEAVDSKVMDVNAMTLCTVDAQQQPHARIVLLKGIEAEHFIFYSNYLSLKGRQIEENPRVSLVFFWPELQRQVRVLGLVHRLGRPAAEAYFQSRPEGSQLGAWASEQSATLQSREALEQRYRHFQEKFKDTEIPCPPHWGGYACRPQAIEFWQGRRNRLHDRLLYQKEKDVWNKFILAP